MKFGIFVHPKRPKVPVSRISSQIKSAGAKHSQDDPDIAIVVGGDGTFGYYGRKLSVPALFVGVKDPDAIGSRANLAEVMYDRLGRALQDIEAGRYLVVERKMLSVSLNGHSENVLTDVYLERGRFAGCLRYMVQAKSLSGHSFVPFSDYAIGNGMIVSTPFGAGGYYSYPDRLRLGRWGKRSPVDIDENRIGICHIIPTYLMRKRRGLSVQSKKIRYTVALRSSIHIRLLRNASACLYGTSAHSRGVPVVLGDSIAIGPAKRTAKIVKIKAS